MDRGDLTKDQYNPILIALAYGLAPDEVVEIVAAEGASVTEACVRSVVEQEREKISKIQQMLNEIDPSIGLRQLVDRFVVFAEKQREIDELEAFAGLLAQQKDVDVEKVLEVEKKILEGLNWFAEQVGDFETPISEGTKQTVQRFLREVRGIDSDA